jgi:micrococcal nuclease
VPRGFLGVIAVVVLLGCSSQSSVELVRVVDGDTIVVSVDGDEERVRLLGMDAPERGECGFDQATNLLKVLLGSGAGIQLIEGSKSDRDSFGRLLRYVDVAGKDLGLELVTSGVAIAGYDSTTGYPVHDREADYRGADAGAISGCP